MADTTSRELSWADIEAAKRWIDKEFQPSTLTKAQQQKELEWFINAAKPFKGMWNIFALPDVGLLGRGLNELGFDYNYTRQPGSAWFTLIAMDVWHWTSLVVLLAYAGLSAIPDAYYQAARIDGASRWAIFRRIQLPKMKRVLTIAVLLRFMRPLSQTDVPRFQ